MALKVNVGVFVVIKMRMVLLQDLGEKKLEKYAKYSNYVLGVNNKINDAFSNGHSYSLAGTEYLKYKKYIKKADSILKKLNKEKIDILYDSKIAKDGKEYMRYALIDYDDPSNSFKNIKKSNIYELEME